MATELSSEEKAAMAVMEDETTTRPETALEETEGPPEGAEGTPEEKAAEPADRRSKTVPHQALHEERERRKGLEKDLAQAREERARFDERLRIIQEMQRPAQQPQQAIPRRPEGVMPDPDSDPIGAVKWMKATHDAQAYENVVQGQQYQQQMAQQNNMQALVQGAMQEFAATIKERPEVKTAYEHYQQSRGRELAAGGWNQQQISQQLYQEDARIVQNARQRGLPLGDVYIQYAEARGWQDKPAGPPATTAVDKITNAGEAQARGKSLSQVGGGAAIAEMTVDRLLSMPNEEFSAWKVKHPKGFEKLMGG